MVRRDDIEMAVVVKVGDGDTWPAGAGRGGPPIFWSPGVDDKISA